MIILEIFYLHVLCYNIYVIFVVVITRPLKPQFIVSHRTSEIAGTALTAGAARADQAAARRPGCRESLGLGPGGEGWGWMGSSAPMSCCGSWRVKNTAFYTRIH